jgi:DNA-directed RNA polymerase subunit L
MEKIVDIDYEIIRYNEELGNSILELNIKGKNINYIIINTIRRTILSEIPIYAFSDFNFTVNESIFNNNYMKLRLRNMPVWGIPNKIDKFEQNMQQINNVLENEDLINGPIDDDIDLENKSNVNTSSLNQLTMYVDYKNTENTIITVTTNEAKFYHSNKNIQNPYPIAIPLIKLQPDQSIIFSAITMLGTEKENSIYSATSVCYYNEINENEFKFILESRGQLTEKRIVNVALINIVSSLENLIKMIPLEQNNHIGEIIINGENNTIGNLLSYGLQNHKNVKFAGYNVPHLLDNKVVIHYELINLKIKLKDVFNDVIVYLIEIFKRLIKLNNNKSQIKTLKKASKKISKKI